MSMKALQKALKGKVTDDFETGTVIRWTASGQYTYAALKAGNGTWYTTAAATNPFVGKMLSFEGLIEVLQRSETSDVAVATVWVDLT